MLAAAVLGLCFSTAAEAQTPAKAVNDNYRKSLSLNFPGEPLEADGTLRDKPRTTVDATVQTDVFDPPSSGGPAELTKCKNVTYGNTLWYDFYPHLRGFARIRAAGYDTVITVVPFDKKSFRPNFGRALCANSEGSTGTEEFVVEVARGRAYTVQIGAVGGAAGVLDFRFDFLPDQDGDQVLDETDSCPKLAGTRRNGCPPRLQAEALLRASPIAGGIEVVGLEVSAPKRSRVAVSCTSGCAREVREGRSGVRFRRIAGSDLRAGSSIVIRVTRKGAIGAYIRYRVMNGDFDRIERCTNPGSTVPRRRCG